MTKSKIPSYRVFNGQPQKLTNHGGFGVWVNCAAKLPYGIVILRHNDGTESIDTIYDSPNLKWTYDMCRSTVRFLKREGIAARIEIDFHDGRKVAVS